MQIKPINEKERGCGLRKKGGLYMFSSGIGYPCDKLPIPLTCCPTCGQGVKFSRAYSWIRWELLNTKPCSAGDNCDMRCPLNNKHQSGERVGLMSVGTKFYPTPADFIREGDAQGVSKRISAIPKDFVVGQTWIALSHMKAIRIEYTHQETCDKLGIDIGGNWTEDQQKEYDENRIVFTPGIFQLFKPTEIQYVVKGDETVDELESMEKRGITLVDVHYDNPELQKKFDLKSSNDAPIGMAYDDEETEVGSRHTKYREDFTPPPNGDDLPF